MRAKCVVDQARHVTLARALGTFWQLFLYTGTSELNIFCPLVRHAAALLRKNAIYGSHSIFTIQALPQHGPVSQMSVFSISVFR